MPVVAAQTKLPVSASCRPVAPCDGRSGALSREFCSVFWVRPLCPCVYNPPKQIPLCRSLHAELCLKARALKASSPDGAAGCIAFAGGPRPFLLPGEAYTSHMPDVGYIHDTPCPILRDALLPPVTDLPHLCAQIAMSLRRTASAPPSKSQGFLFVGGLILGNLQPPHRSPRRQRRVACVYLRAGESGHRLLEELEDLNHWRTREVRPACTSFSLPLGYQCSYV